MNFFQEKINVVIIAGASGIGREIARAYLNEGANVFVCDISEPLIEQFKTEFPSTYIKKVDVSSYDQVKVFFNELKKEISTMFKLNQFNI